MTKKLTGPALVAYLRSNPTSDVMRAAADEIERYRLALTTIKGWPVTSVLNMDAYNMQVVAHSALSGDTNG